MFRSLRKPAPIERHDSYLPESSWPFMGHSGTSHVGDYRALSLPSFFRGLAIRSDILSTLPLVVELDGKMTDFLPPIVSQPDPTEDRQTTLSRMASSLVLRGEVLAVLGDFDSDGFPQALKVVDPYSAALQTDGTWVLNGKTYSRDEILHMVGLALPGEPRGISRVEMFRQVLDGEHAARDFQRNFYTDGGLPTAVVSVGDPNVSPDELNAISVTWREKVYRKREPVFLPKDTTVQPLAVTNSDSQFLESRQFTLTDIAHIVGLPPYFVGAPGSSNTYANIQDQNRQLLDTYLRGDVYLIERAFTTLIESPLKVKYNTKSFLRLNPREEAQTLQIQAAWMTIDEIRAIQGMDPLPDGAGRALATLTMPGSPGLPKNIEGPPAESPKGDAQ